MSNNVTPSVQTDALILDKTVAIVNDIEFTKESSFRIFGRDIDTVGTYMNLFVLLCVVIVMYITGLYQKRDAVIIAICYVLFVIHQIFIFSTVSGSIPLETSKLIHTDQSILALFGSVVILLFVVNSVNGGNNQSNKQSNKQSNMSNRLLIITMMVIVISSIRVNYKNTSGVNIRRIRKFKQLCMNFSLFLVFITLYEVFQNSPK